MWAIGASKQKHKAPNCISYGQKTHLKKGQRKTQYKGKKGRGKTTVAELLENVRKELKTEGP